MVVGKKVVIGGVAIKGSRDKVEKDRTVEKRRAIHRKSGKITEKEGEEQDDKDDKGPTPVE